jgi:GAF domain-containing protein
MTEIPQAAPDRYAWLRRVFPVNKYPAPLDRRRAITTYILMTALFFISVAGLIASALWPALGQRMLVDSMAVRWGAQIIIGIGIYLLIRNGRQALAALIMSSLWFLAAILSLLTNQPVPDGGYAMLLIGITLVALLLDPSVVVLAFVISFGAFVSYVRLLLESNPDATLNLFTAEFIFLLVHGVINFMLARSLREVASQVSAQVRDRSERLSEASQSLAQNLLSARMDMNALLLETVNLVRSGFADVQHCQIYMLDKERVNASLMATTDPTGKTGAQITVGSLHVVGRTTISGESVLVRESAEQFRRAAFIPNMKAQLVLPLQVANEIIGALDVQSESPLAFQEEEKELLQAFANQIAVVIDNARLFRDSESRGAENQRLLDQAQDSLQEIERLNHELTGGRWSEYLKGFATIPAYTIDVPSGRVDDTSERTSTLTEAARRNQIITRISGTHRVLAMPITVRGYVIGSMEFEIGSEQTISSEQMVILRQVVERLGLAVENVRLLEETQRIAQRETMVNEVTSRMQTATSVEMVISNTVESIADALQAQKVSIRLGSVAPSPSAASERILAANKSKNGTASDAESQ